MPSYGIQYLADYEELGKTTERVIFQARDDRRAIRSFCRRAANLRCRRDNIEGEIFLFRLNRRHTDGTRIAIA